MLERLRVRGVAASGLRHRRLELCDPADPDDADVDDLDLRVEAVAVLCLVGAVEGVLELVDPPLTDLAGGHVEADLVALAGVAAVRQAPHEAPVLRHAVRVELRHGLRRELVVARAQPADVEALERMPLGRHELVLEVGGEEPGRGDDPRVRRHEHARDLELERDVAREEGPGSARGHERELTRVVSAAHRVDLDRLGHAELLDLERAECGLLDRHLEGAGQTLHRRPGLIDVELHVAPEQAAVRAESSEQELGVGRRGLGSAAAVAGRARVRSRRLRPDAEDAALVDVRDRAAAGADGVDVDHRHHRLVVADLRVEEVAHPQLAVRGHADVGRRSADVEGDDVLVAGHLARPRCRRSGLPQVPT